MGQCCSRRQRRHEPLVATAAASGADGAGGCGPTVDEPDEPDVVRMPDCVPGCVFCGIVGGYCDAQIVHQTERLVVFHDRSPAATAHLQVVPRQHYDNLHDLPPPPADHALVVEMLQTGREVLQQLHPGAPHKFGFHKPPFNSVLHLHMHALALPYLPGAPTWKYSTWAPWWLPVEDVLAELELQAGKPKGM